MQAKEPSVELATLESEKAYYFKPPQAACRYMWRLVGVRAGPLRDDVEVEDDAVSNSVTVAAHAVLRRMSQKDEATFVFHECLRS